MPEVKKRETAYKLRIGDLLRGNQIFEQYSDNPNPRLVHVELGDKKIVRVNIIANVVDRFESQRETKFASITMDDGSGQIKARVFREEISKINDITHGDTVLVIGLVRSFNKELYVLPEIIKKYDPKYLLVRKLEIDKENKVYNDNRSTKAFRDQIIDLIKSSEKNDGIDKEEIIMALKDSNPKIISEEIKRLLEDGIIYEPRPGRVRYLG